MFRIIVFFVLFIWQLPQNVLGFVIYIVLNMNNKIVTVEKDKNRLFVHTSIAISLGYFIFWNVDLNNKIFILSEVNKYHEYGHSKQSVILGPFYLFIIGIPSSLRTFYARFYFRKHKTKWNNYYKGFPEKWADKLARIDSTIGRWF